MTVVSTTPTTYYNAFQTTLKRSMTSASQTTGIILNPIYDNDDVFVMYTTTPLLLTFIQGTKKEIISAGGFTQDAAGAITLTDVTRDLPRDGSSYTGQGNPVKFTSNATVLAGLTTQSMNKTVFKDAANTFTGLQTFTGGALPPTFADATARDAAFPSPTNGLLIYNTALGVLQQYIGGTWTNVGDEGIANGSTTVAGKYEEATVAEQGTATATGATGARLVIANANLISTSSGAGDVGKIFTLNASGQIPSGFLPTTSTSISGFFGDGSDGDLTLSGNITITRDMHYDNLDLVTFTLNTGGFKVYVKNTLTGTTGKIKGQTGGNGGNGGVGTIIAAGAAGAAATGTSYPTPTAGVIGGTGRTGGVGAGSNGTQGVASTNSITSAVGTLGGAGGNATGGHNGGAGGIAGVATYTGKRDLFSTSLFASNIGGTWTSLTVTAGASSGGGGASGTGGSARDGGGGGGSGANGGTIGVFAKIMAGTFTFESLGGNGGNGGNGDTGAGSSGGGGGGAGGAGGCAIIAYSRSTWTGSFALTGGTGGTAGTGASGGSNGTAGANGTAGTSILYIIQSS